MKSMTSYMMAASVVAILGASAFETAAQEFSFSLQTPQAEREEVREKEMMKKVTLISTGGTIAMTRDPVTGGLEPALSGEELARAAGVPETVSVKTIAFSNIPSEYMTPAMMLALSKTVEEAAKETDGIVITHGTDTMEETAYFLSLVLKTDTPVVMTGAMKGASEENADGPGNLALAMRVAQDEEARGRGVLVCMNGNIFDARHVSKKHTTAVAAFDAGEYGAAAREEDGKLIWREKEIKKGYLSPVQMGNRVWIVTCGAGTDGDILRAALHEKVDGIVIEALGCGNVPESIARGIPALIAAGIPVIITARIGEGGVKKEYDGIGGLGTLVSAGCISGGTLSGHKARILLMTALGNGKNQREISEIFHKEA